MDCEISKPESDQVQASETQTLQPVLEESANHQVNYTEQLASLHNEINENRKDYDCPTPDTSDDELQEELDAQNGSDDEFEGNPETKFKTKNELKSTQAQIIANETTEERYKRYKIDAEQINDLVPVGIITTIMNENLVIQSNSQEVLDLDNLLFTKDKIILGNIDDVFGRVDDPRYTLYRDGYISNRIIDGMIKVGDTVFYEKSLSKILPQNQINLLKSMKGSDASNKFDEEVLGHEDVEFSDDEKEEAFKSELNKKKKNHNNNNKPETSKPKEKIEYKQHKKMNNFNANLGMTQNGMTFINFQNPQPFMMNPQQGMTMPIFTMNPQMMMSQQPVIFGMPMQNAPLNLNPMYTQNQMMQQVRYTPQPLLNNQQQQMNNGGFQMQNGFNRNFYQ